jgi:hypothetical protein
MGIFYEIPNMHSYAIHTNFKSFCRQATCNAVGRVLKFISGVSIPFQVITFLGSCAFYPSGENL